jgi:hypothetical protein
MSSVRLSCARKNTTPRWETFACQWYGQRTAYVRHTGDSKIADQLIRVLGIDDVVDQVQVDVFTSNDWRALFVFEPIKGS